MDLRSHARGNSFPNYMQLAQKRSLVPMNISALGMFTDELNPEHQIAA